MDINEKELITGKPSTKTLPIAIILIGIVLLIITAVTGWSWTDLEIAMYCICPVIIIIGIVLYVYAGMCSITVTDKRVYGKAGFGSRVDLPIDMISAVGITGILHGVEVATSSGRIKFLYIENAEEIHSVINKMLMERQEQQQKTFASTTSIVNQELSSADEIKKYKELLDSGIITQEEFNLKKKQLLDI